MIQNTELVNRIREALAHLSNVEEKKMFGGTCFMVDDKMCVCTNKDNLLCRIGPEKFEAALEKNGCREMIHNGRTMKGFVFVSSESIRAKKEFDYWLSLALGYNKIAVPSKKRKKM